MAKYGEAAYWNQRYTRDPEPFDWYQRWAGVKDVLKEYIEKKHHILSVGCGNSRASEDMFSDGYKHITNIDISPVVIEAMQKKYKTYIGMTFSVMDVTDMRDFAPGTFDVVFDKGTLDSLLCGEGCTQNAFGMLGEVSRVLKPGGRYICISFGQPSFRATYLDREEYGWVVEIKAVPKPTIGTQVALAAEDKDGVHYIYICTRHNQATA